MFEVEVPVVVHFTHTETVIAPPVTMAEGRVKDARSLVPSNTIQPPLDASKVGPFTSVALVQLPLKFVNVVPEPG